MALTFLDAAEAVLREAGTALHYKEIARRALEKGLFASAGATPDASMGAALYTAVKKAEEAAQPGRFLSAGRAQFALATPVSKGSLDDDILQRNEKIEAELLAILREMHPRQLELLVGRLLGELGFEDVRVTKYVGDNGIDVEATLTVGGVTKVKTAIQVKRYAEKNKIDGSTVRELRGGLMTDQRGLVITTSSFTPPAIAEAEGMGKTPISLVDGKRLIQLLVEKQIGVRRKVVHLVELNLADLVTADDGGADEKSATLWPLPGGQEQFFETLLAFLDEIAAKRPTLDELTEWVLAKFERVTKERLVQSYVRAVLYSMGVVDFDGDRIVITPEGEGLRKSRDGRELYRILTKNILGIEEVVSFLRAGPLDVNTLHARLADKLKVSWETDVQVRYRLQWLAACGVVERDEKKWTLTELGREGHNAAATGSAKRSRA
jgi:hypothetical protein